MNASSDYFRQIEALRPTLLKYARLQLRNPAWAEDAVSDTLLAKTCGFSREHKLVDQIRKNCREVSTSATSEDGEDLEDLLFSSNGHWRETQLDWGNPEDALRQLDFMKVLEACVEKLPGQQGRLFMMREWLELDSDEICKELSITPTNLWVMLHRARLRLRECLQAGWFGQKAAGGVN